MAARTPSVLRSLANTSRFNTPISSTLLTRGLRHQFHTSRRLLQDVVVSPRKPIGAFRGSLFGFLFGTVLAGGGLYYYVVDDYKVSNELLVEDIYALQAAVQRLEGYVKGLEENVKAQK